MSVSTTTHYGLKKPDGSEPIKPDSFNENAEVIDEQMYKNSVLTGTTAPATSTAGAVGQYYLNTTDSKLYRCTFASSDACGWRPIDSTNWVLMQTYATAGTFSWTAPDLYGDGKPYLIGAFIMGAGGAGAGDANDIYGGGGGGGHVKNTIMKVTPGNSYPVVIGAAGISAAGGGTSSFNGITAVGGSGGSTSVGGAGGSGGGAAGDDGHGVGGHGGSCGKDGLPARGDSKGQQFAFNIGGIGDGSRCINIFDSSMPVSGGGGGRGLGGNGYGGIGYGGSGGDGGYGASSIATGNGNGGGGCSSGSGYGTPGLVLIYKRG